MTVFGPQLNFDMVQLILKHLSNCLSKLVVQGTTLGMEKLEGTLGPWKTFTKVYLPHALPHILVGLKLGLSISWMAVVAAEMIAATSGIGYRMSNARSMMQADIVIVCMIVVGLVGVLMDKLLGWLLGLATPWMKHEKKNG